MTSTLVDAFRTIDALLQTNGYTEFDADHGTELWHTRSPSGSYVGDGVLLSGADVIGDASTWTATDAATAKKRWSIQVPSSADISAVTTIGANFWSVNTDGAFAVDSRTGRTVMNRVFPDQWHDVYATPEVVVAYDGQTLQLVRTADIRQPLWQVKADQVSSVAASADTVLVDTPAGVLALDGKTGEQRSLALEGDAGNWQTVDGLALGPANDVVELSPPSGRS
jgi:outer membrane protein assembly factor BamB